MYHVTPKRIAAPLNIFGLVPYLKVLTILTGLLVVWAGLCAI
jgi:hypothetical protein